MKTNLRSSIGTSAVWTPGLWTTLCLSLALTACDDPSDDLGDDELTLRGGELDDDCDCDADEPGDKHKKIKTNSGTDQLHLEDTVRFDTLAPGADPVRGQAVFGLAADGVSEDPTEALFEGPSMLYGGPVVSNGRTCFTCHRGPDAAFGLGPLPLSAHVPPTDTLFTGLNADAQGDPDGFFNLDQLGLVKHRLNRFNPTRGQEDPFRQVFGWRKSVPLTNVAFAHGLLTDGRGRVMLDAARGAVFAHTQEADERFDDLLRTRRSDFDDVEAFLFSIVSDPQLLALRDPGHPDHDALVENPFLTVDLQADGPSPAVFQARKKGRKVFKNYCYRSCHNTPNVFNNLSNMEGVGNGERPEDYAPMAPSTGRTFNIGVSERNAHGLRFSKYVGGNVFAPIVLPLANEDGSVDEHTVEFDVGLAGTTGRTEDIGRFKVPQLRNLAANAPYFHDNSAATIADVVDYFCSDEYNGSKDGMRFPIHLTPTQRDDLIAFLEIL